MRVEGSEFRVWSSGFGVQGSGFQVQGSGFRVQGAGCRVQGSGCQVQGSGFRVQGAGCRVQGAGIQGSGFRVQDRRTSIMVLKRNSISSNFTVKRKHPRKTPSANTRLTHRTSNNFDPQPSTNPVQWERRAESGWHTEIVELLELALVGVRHPEPARVQGSGLAN